MARLTAESLIVYSLRLLNWKIDSVVIALPQFLLFLLEDELLLLELEFHLFLDLSLLLDDVFLAQLFSALVGRQRFLVVERAALIQSHVLPHLLAVHAAEQRQLSRLLRIQLLLLAQLQLFFPHLLLSDALLLFQLLLPEFQFPFDLRAL